jgi:hypothetical protein
MLINETHDQQQIAVSVASSRLFVYFAHFWALCNGNTMVTSRIRDRALILVLPMGRKSSVSSIHNLGNVTSIGLRLTPPDPTLTAMRLESILSAVNDGGHTVPTNILYNVLGEGVARPAAAVRGPVDGGGVKHMVFW